jgi:2-dehydro-3-deoxyglucarate aldolase/4-hydroxy-2-oxoheptanedioate aldolase
MRNNTVKSKLAAGQVPLGTFAFEFNTPGIARIMAEAGADFVVFDMEHTGWSVETIKTLIATTRSTSLVPIVRVPATYYDFIARVLDMGTLGVMVPMVESAEQAQAIVAAAKYPPVGRRGAAFGVAHDDYAGGDIAPKIESANREGLLLPQIETAAGLANVDAIAAVPGVNVLWVGQFDLSLSLGIPGELKHPRMIAAMDEVVAACRRHGKTAGIMAPDLATGKQLLQQGFRMMSYSGDLWVYQAALREGLAALRSAAK